MIAKLVCSMNKPGKQTIVLSKHVNNIFENTPITSVRNLGGKLGFALMEKFGVRTMGELRLVPTKEILANFPDEIIFLTRILEGEDDEPIRAGTRPKSLAVSKNFQKSALSSITVIRKWIYGLAVELSRRLSEDQFRYQRTIKSLVVGFTISTNHYNQTFPIFQNTPSDIEKIAWRYIKSFNKETGKDSWHPPIQNIHMSATKFNERVENQAKKITSWFSNVSSTGNNSNDMICTSTSKSQNNEDKVVTEIYKKNDISIITLDDDEEEEDSRNTSTTNNIESEQSAKVIENIEKAGHIVSGPKMAPFKKIQIHEKRFSKSSGVRQKNLQKISHYFQIEHKMIDLV